MKIEELGMQITLRDEDDEEEVIWEYCIDEGGWGVAAILKPSQASSRILTEGQRFFCLCDVTSLVTFSCNIFNACIEGQRWLKRLLKLVLTN